MATPSPSPKKSRKISQVINDNPLHNLYQVMYNPTADQTEIPRHAFHCFLNGKGDYLKIRLYALVDLKEESSEEQEQAIAVWKGYRTISEIEEITAVEKLAQSIILGEMHTSGNQKKFRKQDPDEIKLHLDHSSEKPIVIKLVRGSSQTQYTDFMDLCCDAIRKSHLALRQEDGAVPTSKKHAVANVTEDQLHALRKENERLQQELKDARRQVTAAIGGYDKVDPKILVANQPQKGTSKLQPSIKQAKKVDRGFASDEEW